MWRTPPAASAWETAAFCRIIRPSFRSNPTPRARAAGCPRPTGPRKQPHLHHAHHGVRGAFVLLALLPFLPLLPAQGAAPGAFALPQFAALWQRTDGPVAGGQAARSWLWGPTPGTVQTEPFAGAPGGLRTVQYFDKARMEANPDAAPGSRWATTTGLLVVEMTAGRVQVGPDQYEDRQPADLPVAGDATVPAALAAAVPTYRSFHDVASLPGGPDRRATVFRWGGGHGDDRRRGQRGQWSRQWRACGRLHAGDRPQHPRRLRPVHAEPGPRRRERTVAHRRPNGSGVRARLPDQRGLLGHRAGGRAAHARADPALPAPRAHLYPGVQRRLAGADGQHGARLLRLALYRTAAPTNRHARARRKRPVRARRRQSLHARRPTRAAEGHQLLAAGPCLRRHLAGVGRGHHAGAAGRRGEPRRQHDPHRPALRQPLHGAAHDLGHRLRAERGRLCHAARLAAAGDDPAVADRRRLPYEGAVHALPVEQRLPHARHTHLCPAAGLRAERRRAVRERRPRARLGPAQ